MILSQFLFFLLFQFSVRVNGNNIPTAFRSRYLHRYQNYYPLNYEADSRSKRTACKTQWKAKYYQRSPDGQLVGSQITLAVCKEKCEEMENCLGVDYIFAYPAKCFVHTNENSFKKKLSQSQVVQYIITFRCPAKRKYLEDTCGRPKITPKLQSKLRGKRQAPPISKQIVGGEEAKKNSWPWQALVKIDVNGRCGGSVITKHYVISAAHCFMQNHDVIPRSKVKVILGEHRIDAVDDTEIHYDVQRIIIHDGYESVTKQSDIALLRLTREITFNDYVSPVCLASSTPLGESCVTTGFGVTKGTGKENVLNEVDVELLSPSRCANYFDFSSDSMICSNGEGKDSCKGDSGGPLVCFKEGRWHLTGITSYGINCAIKDFPGVYTKVESYIDWINSIISGD